MSHIFNRFPRMIRDLSKSNNKKLNLNIEGEGIELDRTILDEIGDPLVHLLRNSVDHGIETPEERKNKGKPETGNVDLIAERKRNHVLIEVKDDGKGIDPNLMKKTAVKKGLKTQEEVDRMDDQEALNLLWLPGLSSKEKITNVSGRGVGMDVVKSTIEKLNGAVEFTSEKDKGSTFSLKLPLTMAIFKSLFVGTENETYAIPISNIIETVKLDKNEIKTIKGSKTTLLRNEVLPLVSLADLLEIKKEQQDENNLFAVVVQKEEKKYGLIVDRLIGEQEITIKNVGGTMKRTKGVAGVTITGDGRVILVLDINTLIR
jgi:two-component system, chemotaxis family, sensor kinase CheA